MTLPQPPLISIITPTFNRANYLVETITSVLQQTYDRFELLIIDNGSTDDTRKVVHSFQDPRIRYFYQENSGSPVSPRNRGFREASGEIICFLDSDDLWLPEKLSSQVSYFHQNPSVGLVYSDCYLINQGGKVHGRYSKYHKPHQGNVLPELLRSNFIAAVTVALKKEMLAQFGHLDETYQIAHDLHLYLRIANACSVGYIDRPLAKLRIHSVSLSQNRIKSQLECMEVIKPWCHGQIENNVPLQLRDRIWAFRSFITGLEALGTEGRRNEARYWLKEAVNYHRVNPLYWMSMLLCLAPLQVAQQIIKFAKSVRSVDCVVNG